ncbi:MAG: DEAD/DEAH box helicase [Chloroflexi bacterium]|nr:DEAD/DEAH box helicase [Chloroflexota bacterium]
MTADPLSAFAPAVRTWFVETLGAPTPPQAQGWPPIQRGEHTLILSPTGSGKTLAAFLWGINRLYEELAADEGPEGVELLYISPLKALNNDIERNLRVPRAGIRQVARRLGEPDPDIRVMVRTGDTPQSARASMVKRPPHILITTPESLYLILTSPVAREMFRSVRTVIIDEIHTLCSNKRGVHLALSLERLEHLADEPPQRIGLSATQRPLDEVARFLGGYAYPPPVEAGSPPPRAGEPLASLREATHETGVGARPVTIVDAGTTKPLDLQVVTVARDFADLPGGSIWPLVIPRTLNLIRQHHTTLVYANSRRQAERAADRLNEQYAVESKEEGPPGDPTALLRDGVPVGQGFLGTGRTDGPFRAHHGSVSKEMRLELEQDLKAGRLPALIGTSSLELGIDIGSVDLVVQLGSPKGVARGLQRVGRSGHLVGQTSKGRFFPLFKEDLVECGALAGAMLRGDVEPTYTPQNCLDVLAQQVVAMVSVQDWDVDELYALVRRAYPYHRLSDRVFRGVLDMLAGKYPSAAFRELRPRIAWDRVHDRLAALPGSRLLAIRNGGTIPDQGTFGAYLPDRKTKIGTLDEEFVYETRPGDTMTLGSQTWRVLDVTDDRVVVSPAPGAVPRMPFWRGDAPRRDYHTGLLLGRFRRELAERIESSLPPRFARPSQWEGEPGTGSPPPLRGEGRGGGESSAMAEWLQRDHALDRLSALTATDYVRRQLDAVGAISSDRTVLVETFQDAVGDLRLVIHSCFGARVNSPWALALVSAFREFMGHNVEVQVNDDGILFRFLEVDREPPVHLVREMGATEARERLLAELPNSALFGAQFRMNAARALLLPGASGAQKRTPFWLQRLRAKDLLAVAKDFDDFPIVAETYRDCLRDVLDMEHLTEVLNAIQAGDIKVVEIETAVPSPVAASLLFDFIAIYMYEHDAPKAERQMQALAMNRELLSELLDEAALPDLLRPEALRDVAGSLQRTAPGTRARTAEELTTLFLALGDLTADEVAARCDPVQPGLGGDAAAWLHELTTSGRLVEVTIPTSTNLEARYVLAEHYPVYRTAFDLGSPSRHSPLREREGGRGEGELAPYHTPDDACRAILRRFLNASGPVTRAAVLHRYAFQADWLDETLTALVESGELVSGRISPDSTETEFCDRRNLERIHRRTLTLLRKEVQPVNVYAYADFLARWQGLHPEHYQRGPGGLVRVLQQLRAAPASFTVWERDLLPLRLPDFRPTELEALCQRGELVWVGSGGTDLKRGRVRFLFRGEGALFLDTPPLDDELGLSDAARRVRDFLRSEGACFFADLQAGLRLSPDALAAALGELVLAGLVTNDTIAGLYELVERAPAPAGTDDRPPLSSLEAELQAWRAARPGLPVSPGRYRQAKRDVARRLGQTPGQPDLRWSGRWGLVHRIGVWGPEKELPLAERLDRQARQLMQRYGIVTRQSLEGEEGAWDWGLLYPQFQRMEMRGEARRGYFVEGLPGVQFALPEAVERLRAWGQLTPDAEGELVLLNAGDPANVCPYMEVPDGDPARFSRLPSNYVVLLRGRPVLLFETARERVTTLPGLEPSVAQRAFELCRAHIASWARRVSVQTWNGEPVLNGPAQPLLEALGFRREPPGMVWEGN